MKRFESDNLNGDGGVWNRSFPKLQEGISTPRVKSDRINIKESLREKFYTYIETVQDASAIVQHLSSQKVKNESTMPNHISFDYENCINQRNVAFFCILVVTQIKLRKKLRSDVALC